MKHIALIAALLLIPAAAAAQAVKVTAKIDGLKGSKTSEKVLAELKKIPGVEKASMAGGTVTVQVGPGEIFRLGALETVLKDLSTEAEPLKVDPAKMTLTGTVMLQIEGLDSSKGAAYEKVFESVPAVKEIKPVPAAEQKTGFTRTDRYWVKIGDKATLKELGDALAKAGGETPLKLDDVLWNGPKGGKATAAKGGKAAPAVVLPVNFTCPVKPGQDYDPAYTVTYKGKLIGLCCKACIGKFNADPEKYMKVIE